MASRPYRSPRRAAASHETRVSLVVAATALLNAPEGSGSFSLDAVAEAVGVRRLTVYRHFGSRRVLLEEVLDDIVIRGGLFSIAERVANQDPCAELENVVEILCEFFTSYRTLLSKLHAASFDDAEFRDSLRARNDRRRRILAVLVGRIFEGREAEKAAIGDLIDILVALTSFQFLDELARGERTAPAICKLVQVMARDAVRRVELDSAPARAN